MEYEIVIGSGGSGGRSRIDPRQEVISPTNGGDTVAFGATAGGGKVSTAITSGASLISLNWQYLICGGSGGSGGGQSVGREITTPYNVAGAGGSDGSDGGAANPQPNATRYPIGTGQGTTTREFGEATGKLYAGGGGAGNILGAPTPGGGGGAGNGGSGMNATPNTGGGGGGANEGSVSTGGSGGSGIVCIRLHQKKEGLQFNYTGDYVKREDGVVELKSSGAITFPTEQKIDIFCVGGGGRGGVAPSSAGKGGGGGAGYTRTIKKVSAIGSYEVVVGSGSTTDSGTGGTSSFGSYSVPGGNNGVSVFSGGTGGSGGSGGGGAGNGGGSGGSNGNNGTSAEAEGGTGQGFTTREFGEVTGKLYAAGGGGAVNGAGGEGGGGTGGNGETSTTTGTAGEANTGSGGGGGSSYWNPGNGGSGIVCIRESTETLELVGTWKFNSRIYPPTTAFDITANYTIASTPPETGGAYKRIYISNNTLLGEAIIGATNSFYDFATNTPVASRFGYFRTDSVQGFTEEFLAWLASNATKQ